MKNLIIIAFSLYALAFGALTLGQKLLIYPFNPAHETPTAAGEPRLVERSLKTSDGETLVVWSRPAKGAHPTIVYFHGNAGNLALRAQRFDRMIRRGYGVVALAYRGSSGSTGAPSQAAIRSDSIAFRAALPELLGAKPRGKVVYYGESLGTSVALHLAAEIAPDAIILEAPFTAISDIAKRRLSVFPIDLAISEPWDSLSQMPAITMPLLVLHSPDDPVVPFDMGKQIFDAAPSTHKTFFKADNIGHTNHWNVAGQQAIYKFINGL